ncbi:MAG: hemerythrin domain-containing protein [Pseudomonadota bacterium]
MPSIFKLLKEDHDKHREMLTGIADADPADRGDLFEKFQAEAVSHANAEEQSLYAEMMAKPDLQDEARHSVSEHKQIDEYVATLESLDPASDDWLATFLKLKHRYEHHIEEEEDEMFPEAKDALSQDKIQELGDKFADRKPAEKEAA